MVYDKKSALSITLGTAGLKVQNLRKSYNSKPVLRDINLTLSRGEVVALLGPNGAGKTTCFYSIAGLISPDSGNIEIDGTDVKSLPMYRRAQMGIGYLPQEASIFRGLTVEANLNAVLEISIRKYRMVIFYLLLRFQNGLWHQMAMTITHITMDIPGSEN